MAGYWTFSSGGGLYLKRPGYDSFFRMPEGLCWNGTIVAMRIPYQSPHFNFINYIE